MHALACGPDDTLWACTDTTIEHWDVRSGVQLSSGGLIVEEQYDGSLNPIYSAAFLPDGRTAATGMFHGGQIKFRDVWGERVRVPLSVNDRTLGDITDIAVSRDGSTLACSVENDTVHSIQVWDLVSGRQSWVLPLDCRICNLAITPNGHTLYAGFGDTTIRRWDITRRQALPMIYGHQNEINALAISPDGRLLASGGNGRKVRLWDLPTGRQVGILVGHADEVHALSFAPDGKTLASGSRDGSVRLWSVSARLELLSLDMPSSAPQIKCLAFSLNGKTLAAGLRCIDGKTEVHVWSARGDPPTQARRGIEATP